MASYTPWGLNPHCSIKSFTLKKGTSVPHFPKFKTNFGWYEATMMGVLNEPDGYSIIGTRYEHIERPGGSGYYGQAAQEKANAE